LAGALAMTGRAQTPPAPVEAMPAAAPAAPPVAPQPTTTPATTAGADEAAHPGAPPPRVVHRLPAAPASPGPPDVEAFPPTLLEAFVDGAVRQAMAQRHIAGVAVAVVQNGEIVLAKGYGAARVDPWTPVDPARTLFRLGAVSQSLTWIALLQQVAGGHMRLDADINLYLPEALRVRDHGGFRPVRVEDIFDGESGFESRSLGQAYERDFALVRPLAAYLRQERPRRARAPGVLIARTDYAAALAGAAVAEVGGKPFETVVEQGVTGPLDLRHTTFREPHPYRADLPAPMPQDLAGEVSEGYRWSVTGLRRRDFEFIEQRAPSGSASASASDMGRFMAMLLGGGSLGSARVLDPVAAARLTRAGSVFVARALPGGTPALELDGETLSFRSSMTLAPSLGLGVFVAVNTDTGRPLVQGLADRIVEQFHRGGSGWPATASGLLQARGDLEGPWISDRRAFGGLEGFVDRFRALAWVRVLDDQRLLLQQPSGPSRWILEAGGPPLRFRDLDGPGELAFAPGEAPRTFVSPSGEAAYERPGWLDRPELFLGVAGLTMILSLAVLADFPVRLRQSFRESQGQRRAAVIQAIQAALWLAAACLGAVFVWQGREPAALMYGWPGVPLVTASSCVLVASLLLLPILLLMGPVWRGGRRVESWTAGRKFAFTLTSLVFLAFAVLLGLSGALQPWSA
jgi:CubicO group peptidase (beta-lactamase class C family)